MKYKRSGRCNPSKCGAFCCRIGPLAITAHSGCIKNPSYALYDLFNWKSENINKNEILTYPNQNCSKLYGNKCIIHGKNKPYHCKIFPSGPCKWYELCRKHGCTYRFKQLKTVGKIETVPEKVK